MNEISVSDRKSTNNFAEFSIKDEKNYIVNVRKCFFITPDMKYAYMRALSIFEDWGGVGAFYYIVHKPQARRPRSQWLRSVTLCVLHPTILTLEVGFCHICHLLL